ncbi:MULTISPECIES: GNAT family N-acetyltransferase [unclassified Knoellia]|uniref:GNAT family N-acetyltransferase n=1 Tax=Knoellia altitudinis TaxID=3404795 RepID=UPI003610A20E
MTEPTFPDLVLQSITRHGVTPSRGYVTLGHYDALISHYPPEPERPFVVHWTRSDRDPADLFGELTAYLRTSGARSAEWWFRDDSTPLGLEELVLAAGAKTIEDQVCVARAVGDAPPSIAPGVQVTLVQDAEALDAVVDIGVEVFDNPQPDRAALLADVLDELERGAGAWVVGWVDGAPVGRARVGFEYGVAPLVGAAVLPHARRRGVYAAMLAARLDLASTARCHTAVTKARRTQSLPVLLREGFTPIGQERAHLLEIAP